VIVSIPQWRELLMRKRKMFENLVMELSQARHHADASRGHSVSAGEAPDECTRIERCNRRLGQPVQI
jgi:hypothetical protein